MQVSLNFQKIIWQFLQMEIITKTLWHSKVCSLEIHNILQLRFMIKTEILFTKAVQVMLIKIVIITVMALQDLIL